MIAASQGAKMARKQCKCQTIILTRQGSNVRGSSDVHRIDDRQPTGVLWDTVLNVGSQVYWKITCNVFLIEHQSYQLMRAGILHNVQR